MSCASYGAGWWFADTFDCHNGMLTGKYYQGGIAPNDNTIADGISWKSLTGKNCYLVNTYSQQEELSHVRRY